MHGSAPAPEEFRVDRQDIAWAAKTEGNLLALLLVVSALPWAMYAWSELKTFHLVPALQSVVLGFAGVLLTARVLLIPADLLLQRLLPRYRRAQRYRKAVRKFRARPAPPA